VVLAQYTADETLPSGVTESDLESSTVYRAAKREGLVAVLSGLGAALSVPEEGIAITGFTLGNRRLSTAFRKVTGTTSVTTRFKVEVPDRSIATTLATTIEGASAEILAQTNSAMAAADWSGELVITAAPTMTAPTVDIIEAPPICAKHQWYDAANGACEDCPAGLDASEDKTHCVDPVVAGGLTELQITALGLGATVLCGCLSAVAAFAAVFYARKDSNGRVGDQSQ